jgi:hypothetical protein
MTAFRLGDEAQQRLTELTERKTVGLRDERGLCAFLLETAARNGSIGTATALLSTSAKLSLADEAARIRANEVLSRNALLGLIQELVTIVSDELETVPGHEAIVDRIIARVLASVESVENTQPRLREPLKDKS